MGALPDDLLDYYQATLGPTEKIVFTDASVAALPDPLLPARYALILRAASGVWAFAKTVAFQASPATFPVFTADVPAFPLSVDGVHIAEFNVRAGFNDWVGVISEAGGSGTLYVVKISRVRKLP